MVQSQQQAKTAQADTLPAQPMQRRQDVPPELQHSVLWAKERPQGAPSRGVHDLMTAAQASAGNAAVQRALARDTATETPQPKTGAPQEVKAEATEDKAEDSKSVLPQTPAVPQAAPLAAPAGARPQQGQPSGAADMPGAAATTPEALQMQAQQVGQQIAGAPAPQGAITPLAQRTSPPTQRRTPNLTGRAPVPATAPPRAKVPDPIPEATKRIEEAANRKLADQTLPPVTVSPGGHMPDVQAKPLTKEQRRFLLLGEKAMNAAELPKDERAEIKEIRDRILAPPPVGDDGKPLKLELPPAQLIQLKPLPPADLTLGERDLFTAALAQLLTEPQADAQEILNGLKETSETFRDKALLNPYFKDAFEPIGKSKLGDIEKGLRDVAQPMADAIGVAGKTLDDAIAERKTALELERKKAAGQLQQETDAARQTAADNANARNADAAKAKAIAADAKERAAAANKKLKPTFREIADAAVARIKDKVAEAIARFRLMEIERGKALDDARAKQMEGYRDAATADQLAAAVANKVGPDQAPPTDATEQRRARQQVSKAINAAKAWVDARSKLLDTEVKRLKEAVAKDIAANITAVEDEGAAAFRDLKTWGDAQDGAVETWWQDNARNLQSWADKAHDTATTWALAQGKLARLQMQRDLETVRASVETQLVTEGEDAEKFFKMASDKRQHFVDMVVTGEANRPNIAKALAEGARQRVTAAQKPAVEQAFMADALALPSGQWKAMEALAQSKNPGFKADVKSDTIYNAGEKKIGTDEKAIFDALTGLTPLELAAVKAHYTTKHGDMYKHLDSEMSGDEWRRAKALMAGNRGIAAAEAIHDAVWGPGTNEKQIMEALRGLNADERKAAEEYYEKQYGESLSSRLADDMEDSELGQAKALLAGKMEEAEAYEIDSGLRGGVFSPDRDTVTAVYDRVQQESLARAKAEGWTAAELDAEIARRNAVIEEKFGEKFAGVPAYSWGRGQSTLRTAITAAYPFDPANRKLINALADNDMATADAALMQTEREGVYADDSVLKGVVRKQYERGFDRAQLDLGPETSKGVDRRLDAWEKAEAEKIKKGSRAPLTERERIDKRMEFQREADIKIQDEAFERARASSKMLDTVLQANHGITLRAMIDQNMSFGDRREALAQMEVLSRTPTTDEQRRARRLDWAYNRVRYAIEGAGTDMDELKGGLSGLSKKDLEYLDKRWRDDHDKETLKSAVQSDTSGREEDDLVDTIEHGAPQTVADRMDEIKRKLKRDEESVGALGAAASKAESRRTKAELAEMEALAKDLDNPNLDPRKREFLSREVDRRIDHASAAIEAQRAAVDSFADTLTTIFQYVVGAIAVVLAVIVGIVSGGTAVPALIAIAGSLVGTLGSMAIKRSVKGGAYGAEEFGTDLAVGAVDVVVTALTAGAFKGGGFLKGLGAQLKTIGAASIRVAISQTGKRAAAMTAKEVVEGQAKRAGTSALGRLATRAGAVGKDFVKNQAHQFATSLPNALTANVLNERNLRNGNPLKNIARGTLDASLENLKMGAGMAVFGHVVGTGLRHTLVVTHPPMSPVKARLAEYQHWQSENPGKSRADYVAELETKQAKAANDEVQTRLAVKEARRSLLSEIPPRERAAIADVPIVRVSEAEFRALNGGKGGDAMIHIHEGQAAIVMREGAPASAARPLAAELRATVAPGTAGRTVNPAESLPPHLRNRVPIEVNPNLAHDTVKVIPDYHPDGHIRGVKVEIGPNARAVDIQGHVGVIQTMRKYTGLLGRVRVALERVQIRLGFDVVSPLKKGQFEAALEMQKLPPIIEERVRRLSEKGINPREQAAIEADILHLEAQFHEARGRFELGAAAEAKGYVAAKGRQRRKLVEEPQAPKLDPAAEKQRAHAMNTLKELADVEPRYEALEAEHKSLNEAVNRAEDAIVRKAEATLKDRSPNNQLNDRPGLREALERLREGDTAEGMALLDDWVGRQSEANGHARALKQLSEQHAAAEKDLTTREAALRKELDPLSDRRDVLRQELGDNPYYKERSEWFNQLRLDQLGDSGALICFPPETPVATPSGPVPIGQLKAGDIVLSWDPEHKATTSSMIVETASGWTPYLIEIVTETGQVVRATRSHPFYEVDRRGWLPARMLHPGAELQSCAGRREAIIHAEIVQRTTATCNFTAEPYHTYFVGEPGLLVHNGDADERPSNFASKIKHKGIIYAVMLKPDGPIIYVGKTYQTLDARWTGHINNPQKQALGWSRETHKIVVLESGSWTDFEIAVWEEHLIRRHGGLASENPSSKLQNIDHAIADENITEFRKPKYGHNPCL